MDAINYGAIKNLDKKLGLSLGEVGSNFGMTSGQFLVNFDGFDEVNSVTEMKTLNARVDYTSSIKGLLFPYTVEGDNYLYGFSTQLMAFVKHDIKTQETTVINTVDFEFMSDLKSIHLISTVIYPDLGQNKLVVCYSLSAGGSSVTLKVIDAVNQTIESHTYSTSTDSTNVSYPQKSGKITMDAINGYIYVPTYYMPGKITKVGCIKISTSTWVSEIISIAVSETSSETSFTLFDMFVDTENQKVYLSYAENAGTYRKVKLIKADLIGLTSEVSDVSVEGCTSVYSTDSTKNYQRNLFFIGKFEGKIYASFYSSSVLYEYISAATRYCVFFRGVYIDTESNEFATLRILDKDAIYTTEAESISEVSYSIPSSDNRAEFIKNGGKLLINYIATSITNGSSNKYCMIFDTVAKTMIDYKYYQVIYSANYSNLTRLKVLEWDGSKLVLFSAVSFSTAEGLSNYGVYTENDTSWQIETTGETLMVISKIAYQGTTLLIEVDGKQFTKTIPSCSSTDLKERQVLLHAKTGIKIRSLDSVGIDEIFWGVKASA